MLARFDSLVVVDRGGEIVSWQVIEGSKEWSATFRKGSHFLFIDRK